MQMGIRGPAGPNVPEVDSHACLEGRDGRIREGVQADLDTLVGALADLDTLVVELADLDTLVVGLVVRLRMLRGLWGRPSRGAGAGARRYQHLVAHGPGAIVGRVPACHGVEVAVGLQQSPVQG